MIFTHFAPDAADLDIFVDGFTVTAGDARGNDDDNAYGGGLFVHHPEDTNRVVGPQIKNCRFIGNRSNLAGGAIASYNYDLDIRHTSIIRNETSANTVTGQPVIKSLFAGGGISIQGALTLVNSEVIGNVALGTAADHGGGAVETVLDPSILANCFFAGNEMRGPNGSGGGAFLNGPAKVMNCVFSGNECEGTGGGALDVGDGSEVDQSTFYGNSAPNGDGGAILFPTTVGDGGELFNSIAWANTDFNNAGDWKQQFFGRVCPRYSDIQDWDCNNLPLNCLGLDACEDFANICVDPLFVDPDGTDNVLGTEDDDLHVMLRSLTMDKASDINIPADAGDVDDSGTTAEELPLDLDLKTRKFNAVADFPQTVDMGAYERDCQGCPWDLNDDGKVGRADELILMANLGATCHQADFDFPWGVGAEDSVLLLANAGPCPPGICTGAGPGGNWPEEVVEIVILLGFDPEEFKYWIENEASDIEILAIVTIIFELMDDE